jgi:hypothetical protein
LTLRPEDYAAIRSAIATIPGDVSNDAVGNHAARLEDIFAPEAHSTALDPTIPIVVGSRGAGKSFWSSVLGQPATRDAAAIAYPQLPLKNLSVQFGFTGIVGGPDGVSSEALNALVPRDAVADDAKAFWWATIMRAAARATGKPAKLSELVPACLDWESRETAIAEHERRLRAEGKVLLVVYDALDTVATTWPRRRLLTEALLEVVWAMRAYRAIKVKLFLRPDQIDDDTLRFVELPKLRTGAVRLSWSGTDLYGLLYSRLAAPPNAKATSAFASMLASQNMPTADRNEILSRRWPLADSAEYQARVMVKIAGPYMAGGIHGYKKGKTYDWPLKHLGDAFEEVTPRSFLGLLIAAAKRGPAPPDRVITADSLRHGLREASKTRVDQLHLEFPWIKAVLAPLAGLLLPQNEEAVFNAWQRAHTVKLVIEGAAENNYLPPFPQEKGGELGLFETLKRIGVMLRRKDERIDMPDLFRIAAKLLKKGGTAPI